MVFSDSQKNCFGQIDRYQLRHFLTELPLSAKTRLRRFSATDTVTSQTVLLETLPANFDMGSQLLLRQTLARQGIRQYSKVSDWGLPVFMHEIWDLDADAVKSTGLQSGNLLLIYDLDAEDSLSDLLQEGVPALCHQMLFDNLPQLCQLLQAAHQQKQGHGCLQSNTLWITAEGKLGITDFAVGNLLKQLEEKVPENEIQEALPQQDLQDLKKLATELALKAGYLENPQFKAALARVDSLESFQELLQSPPAAAAKATPESRDDSQPVAGKPLRWLNAVFLLAISLLLLLSGFLFWQKQSKKSDKQQTVESSALLRPPALVTRKIQAHLSACFALRFTLEEPLSNSGPLGLTMLGQLSRIEMVFDEQAVRIFQQRSANNFELLAEHKWDSAPAAESSFQVLKTASTLAIYQNHNFVTGCSLEVQQWRQIKWQSDSEYPEAPALAYQRIGNLYFADDFMHSDDALGEWEVQSGEWAVHSLQTPVRSANPFSFIGKKEAAEATAGYWFWRNYRLSCAIRPLDAKYFGLRIARGNEQSSYTVLWQQKTEEAPTGLLTLSRLDRDGEKMLAKCPLAYPAGQWVELAVVNNEGLLQVLVDQRQVIQAHDKKPLLGGKIALLSSGEEGTVFDDVQVIPAPALQLPPEVGAEQKSLLFAKSSTANPERPDEFIHSLRLTQPELSDAQINLELSAGQLRNNTWEMALQHRGYWEVCLRLKNTGEQASAEILSRSFGQEQVLSSQSWTIAPGQELYSFIFQTLGSEAFALCNGRSLVFTSELPKQDSGYAVIRQLTADQDFFSWSRLSYSAPAPLLPAVDKVAMFTHEVSMRSWNNPVLEWLPDGQQYWYQADFWQDLDLNMELAPLLKTQSESEWSLLLGNGEKEIAARLLYRPQEQELILEQTGREKNAERHKFELPPERIALQKRADRLLARANGQVLWNLPLPESLRGLCLAGRSGKGNSLEWANAVQTLAGGIQSYSFQEAPCDWTSAGGTWEVTNRWQCDPRWSFFSGANLEGAACLWNKFQHGENVSIDFFVGPKMDTDRGKKYEYAGDYALVLGADGKDISSGYSFIFGGWDNRGSQIVRQNKIVSENSELKVIRSSQIHRSWFHLKARKNGQQLSFWVDGKLAGTYTDTEPLTGRHFALWTWKNSLMAAQFRISSDQRSPSPDISLNSSKAPKTPYD